MHLIWLGAIVPWMGLIWWSSNQSRQPKIWWSCLLIAGAVLAAWVGLDFVAFDNSASYGFRRILFVVVTSFNMPVVAVMFGSLLNVAACYFMRFKFHLPPASSNQPCVDDSH